MWGRDHPRSPDDETVLYRNLAAECPMSLGDLTVIPTADRLRGLALLLASEVRSDRIGLSDSDLLHKLHVVAPSVWSGLGGTGSRTAGERSSGQTMPMMKMSTNSKISPAPAT